MMIKVTIVMSSEMCNRNIGLLNAALDVPYTWFGTTIVVSPTDAVGSLLIKISEEEKLSLYLVPMPKTRFSFKMSNDRRIV